MQTHPYPPVQGQPPTVMVVCQAPQPQKVENYACKAAIILGVCQIILGTLIIVCSALAMVFDYYGANAVFHGIVFILAGAFQITSGKVNIRCWIITTMVFAILAALFAFSALAMGTIGVVLSNDEHYDKYEDTVTARTRTREESSLSNETGRYLATGFLTLFALVEFIIAIIAAVLTCKPLCCTPQPLQQGMIVTSHYAGQPGQPPQPPSYPGQQAVPGAPPAYTYQVQETKNIPTQ